jgi:hypothetical protein
MGILRKSRKFTPPWPPGADGRKTSNPLKCKLMVAAARAGAAEYIILYLSNQAKYVILIMGRGGFCLPRGAKRAHRFDRVHLLDRGGVYV